MISNIHEWVGCKDIEVRRSEFVANHFIWQRKAEFYGCGES